METIFVITHNALGADVKSTKKLQRVPAQTKLLQLVKHDDDDDDELGDLLLMGKTLHTKGKRPTSDNRGENAVAEQATA